MHLLLEFSDPRGEPALELVKNLLLTLPGVDSVNVDPTVGQATVVLNDQSSLSVDDILRAMRAKGYCARASRVPDPSEGSDYARYYHAAPDSSEGRWVD